MAGRVKGISRVPLESNRLGFSFLPNYLVHRVKNKKNLDIDPGVIMVTLVPNRYCACVHVCRHERAHSKSLQLLFVKVAISGGPIPPWLLVRNDFKLKLIKRAAST